RTSVRHSARSPRSSCANVAASSSSPASSATRTSCLSAAQSTPAQLPIRPPPRRDRFTAPRPGGTVAEPHRQGPQRGYVLLPLVGTSPPPGDASPLWALHTGHGLLALPGGGRGNDRMTYGVSNYSSVHT